MRKFILIAGFVLASATAQGADRSLSLGGSETQRAPAAKTMDVPKTAEAPQAVEAPRYVERPAIEPKVESKAETPKAETPKAETSRAAARAEQPAVERSRAAPARPAFRRTASISRSMKPRRRHHWIEARIIHALHRHGIYW
ncbi:hypothetical protein [Bradyrhizobium archetypum]|jgi:hypothetical protein|uniref:Uncharacterized protein n=1 Tax=Bradyrhizobium archetypum TaxID=2721160 RepID=A0A7Y4M455_9BRAD|nr:hypothetical protein [Bradyrhizobium archetypum]NOJ49577.1 hypothetical protein [Bradyrhizobium archetypum]